MKITRSQLRKLIIESINLPSINPEQSVYEPTEDEINMQDEYLSNSSMSIPGMDIEYEVPSSRLGSSVEIIDEPPLLRDRSVYRRNAWNPDDHNFLDNEFPNYYIMDPNNRAQEYRMAQQGGGYINGKPCIVPLVTLIGRKDSPKKVHYAKEFTGYQGTRFEREPLYFKVTDN